MAVPVEEFIADYLIESKKASAQLAKLQTQFLKVIGASADGLDRFDSSSEDDASDTFTAKPRAISSDMNNILYELRELVMNFHNYLVKHPIPTTGIGELINTLPISSLDEQSQVDDEKLGEVTNLVGNYMREENFNRNDWGHVFLAIYTIVVNVRENLDALQHDLRILEAKLNK